MTPEQVQLLLEYWVRQVTRLSNKLDAVHENSPDVITEDRICNHMEGYKACIRDLEEMHLFGKITEEWI